MKSLRKIFKLGLITAIISFDCGASTLIQVVETKIIDPEGVHYNAWPTVAKRKSGELVLVYSGGRAYHICPFGRLEMMTSPDNGVTWSWPRVLIDSATDDRDAAIIETKTGALLAFFFTSTAYKTHQNDPELLLEKTYGDNLPNELEKWDLVNKRLSLDEQGKDVGMWVLRSLDGGLTWSQRIRVPCNSPHGPTLLRDGRLLYAGKELSGGAGRVGVWESKDDALTWKLLTYLPLRKGDVEANYHELHMVEAADGTLVVQIRNHNGKKRNILQAESKDGGVTWTEPHEIGVSGFPSHLLKLSDGRLLMTYGYRKAPYGIRAKISSDHGQTWSDEIILTSDGANWDLGYPSTVELKDNEFLTIWYEVPSGSKRAQIRQAKWNLAP